MQVEAKIDGIVTAMENGGKPVILITGSEGLIGRALVEAFSADYDVAAFDITRPDKQPEKEDFIDCDLTKDESVTGALAQLRQKHGERIASVIHLAAYYDFSGEPSPLYRDLTVEGTRRLLRGLQSFQVNQFVFSSTHIVLKPSETGEALTESSELEPAWEYPKSKVEAEKVIADERGSVPAVILRIAGVYDEDCHAVPIAQQIDRIYRKNLESYLLAGESLRLSIFFLWPNPR
jgi:nucleoside-diphosphate-sugar epimerase